MQRIIGWPLKKSGKNILSAENTKIAGYIGKAPKAPMQPAYAAAA